MTLHTDEERRLVPMKRVQQDGTACFVYEEMSLRRRTYADSEMFSDSSTVLPQDSEWKAFLQKDSCFVFVF